jgi:hypothetical protein
MSEPVHVGKLLTAFFAPEGAVTPEPKNVKCLLCYSVFTSKAHWFGKGFKYANICQSCAEDWDRHGRDETPYPGEKVLICNKCRRKQIVNGRRIEVYWYYEINCLYCKTHASLLVHRFSKKKQSKEKRNTAGYE